MRSVSSLSAMHPYPRLPTVADIRPTKDLDLTFQLASFAELEGLREQLIEKGFTQSEEDIVNCRFRYEDLKVDVMSTQSVGWAPSNPWFAKGFEKAMTKTLAKVVIKVLPLPYFVATKMEAFLTGESKIFTPATI